MRRSLLVLATACAVVPPLAAQGILGRARDRAQQALQNRNQPATCAPSAYSSAVNTDLTDDAVTRYLRAMQARDAELRRLAQGNDAQGRYFAAVLLRDSLARRHARFKRHVGPDWDRYQQLQNQPPSTDYQVNMQHQMDAQAVVRAIDEDQVHLPSIDWSTQQQASGHLDDVARQAGSFDICAWAVAVDIIPQVVEAMSQDRRDGKPDRGVTEFQVGRPSGLHPGELTVIRAHVTVLADVLTIDYPSDADMAAAQAASQADQARRDSMSAWTACQQRAAGGAGGMTPGAPPSQDSLRSWQAQLQAARQAGDNAKVMQIAQRIQMAMMPNMAQQQMGAVQAQQQCGPMPGQPRH